MHNHEVSEAVTGLMTAFETFKATNDAKLTKAVADAAEARAALDAIEVKLNRPGFGGGREPGGLDSKSLLTGLGSYALNRAVETKVMSAAEDPSGGYTTTSAMAGEILRRVARRSPLRSICKVVSLDSGVSWIQPRADALAEATWVGEKEGRPATDDVDFGQVEVPLNEVYAAPVITQKLLDLSAYNLGNLITDLVGDSFARAEDTAFISGNGVGRPMGILAYDTASTADDVRGWATLQTVNSGSAAAVTGDGLKRLVGSLAVQFRAGASWVMNRGTHAEIAQLKDGNGRYLLQDAVAEGEPDRLLGYPVVLDEAMPAVGAGLMPVIFGDFAAGYAIVDWSTMRLLRDPYSNKPNVVFYAYRRVGGGVVDFDALKVLTISA